MSAAGDDPAPELVREARLETAADRSVQRYRALSPESRAYVRRLISGPRTPFHELPAEVQAQVRRLVRRASAPGDQVPGDLTRLGDDPAPELVREARLETAVDRFVEHYRALSPEGRAWMWERFGIGPTGGPAAWRSVDQPLASEVGGGSGGLGRQAREDAPRLRGGVGGVQLGAQDGGGAGVTTEQGVDEIFQHGEPQFDVGHGRSSIPPTAGGRGWHDSGPGWHPAHLLLLAMAAMAFAIGVGLLAQASKPHPIFAEEAAR